jgi:diguanylate cyclase (GGDEF)-like protein
MLKEYILQNWPLILTLAAFAISLKETVFLDKATIRRMYALIVVIFLLSLVVFTEFLLADLGRYTGLRVVLMAVRYSTTPFIIALVIFTLTDQPRFRVFIPASLFAARNVRSIFNGIVFRVGDDGVFLRGPLGLLPFLAVGLYCVLLLRVLLKRSSKQTLEIIPLAFLGFAFLSGLLFPFVYHRDYAKIFCPTIAIALYVFYVFSILQLTKKDPLTGLLNRQAFYADVESDPENVTALVSIDMNGLKAINDRSGHTAGDEALAAIAQCFLRAMSRRQQCYRTGGDEFVIVCRKTPQSELLQLVEAIRSGLAETGYSCAIGYCHSADGADSVAQMLQRSDEIMYAEKARYYSAAGIDRRHR